MICPHCQNEIPIEDAKFCAYCQKPINSNETSSTEVLPPPNMSQQVVYCSTCGNPCNHNAAVCVKCGSTLNKSKNTVIEDDEPVTGLKVLSLFIPIIGLVLYCVNASNKPKCAKTYGKMALIGFIIGIVSVILYEEVFYWWF